MEGHHIAESAPRQNGNAHELPREGLLIRRRNHHLTQESIFCSWEKASSPSPGVNLPRLRPRRAPTPAGAVFAIGTNFSIHAYDFVLAIEDSHLDKAVAELRAAGCTEVFQEKISGVRADRKQLSRLVERHR